MNYVRLVVRMPDDVNARNQIREGLGLLEPFRTDMSSEDEMTVLGLIEQHEAFPKYIAEEAREEVARLHATYEETKPISDAFRRDRMVGRNLMLEYVSAPIVQELLTTHRGGIFDTTEPVGEVLDYERAQLEMMGV